MNGLLYVAGGVVFIVAGVALMQFVNWLRYRAYLRAHCD